MKYKNKKTGKVFRHLAFGTDHTTERGKVIPVIVYCPDDNENSIHVREEKDFFANFEETQIWGGVK